MCQRFAGVALSHICIPVIAFLFQPVDPRSELGFRNAARKAFAFEPVSAFCVVRKVFAASSHTAARRSAERYQSDPVEIIAFDEGVHDTRLLAPPDREADVDLFISVERYFFAPDPGTDGSVVLLFRGSAAAVVPVEIRRRVFLLRFYFIEIRVFYRGDLFRYALCGTGRREDGDEDFFMLRLGVLRAGSLRGRAFGVVCRYFRAFFRFGRVVFGNGSAVFAFGRRSVRGGAFAAGSQPQQNKDNDK